MMKTLVQTIEHKPGDNLTDENSIVRGAQELGIAYIEKLLSRHCDDLVLISADKVVLLTPNYAISFLRQYSGNFYRHHEYDRTFLINNTGGRLSFFRYLQSKP